MFHFCFIKVINLVHLYTYIAALVSGVNCDGSCVIVSMQKGQYLVEYLI